LAYGDGKDFELLSKSERVKAFEQDELIRKRGGITATVRPATTVRSSNGKTETSAGAFAVGGAPLAGFSFIDAKDVDEIIELVSKTPCAVASGAIEVWPLTDNGTALAKPSTTSENDARIAVAAAIETHRLRFLHLDPQQLASIWDRQHEPLVYVAQEMEGPIYGWAAIERYLAALPEHLEEVLAKNLGAADATVAAQHHALGADRADFGRDGPNQRDFELECRLPDACFERRLDRKPHAAVEERGRKAAMDGAERVEQCIRRRRRDDDAAAFRRRDLVAQRAGESAEG
jgi:hypothetical protein